MSDNLVLVGCGNMGHAMLRGWCAMEDPPSVHVVEPDAALRDRAGALGAQTFAAATDLPGIAPDLIVLAVKPQAMGDVAPAYAAFAGGPATVVSIAAGTTMETLAALLPGPTPLVRCMPNTPAAVGLGMLICCANSHVTAPARARVDRLMQAAGAVDWIEDEGLMDAVTALSGSGPAYVFHMIECMAAAGTAVGLPQDLAARMAMQTVMGAGQYAAASGIPPGTLRAQVTSPGGTTAAALGVLQGDGRLERLMTEAITAARDRGVALGRG